MFFLNLQHILEMSNEKDFSAEFVNHTGIPRMIFDNKLDSTIHPRL